MDEPEMFLVKTNLMPWDAVGSSRSESLSSLNYTTAWGMHQTSASSQLFQKLVCCANSLLPK